MTCTCGHPATDHMDRAFGPGCAPPVADTGSQTRRCGCTGWRLEPTTGSEMGTGGPETATGATQGPEWTTDGPEILRGSQSGSAA